MRRHTRRQRLAGLAIGASCVALMWVGLVALSGGFSQTSRLESGVNMHLARTSTHTFTPSSTRPFGPASAPMRRRCKIFSAAASDELKTPPSLQAPLRPKGGDNLASDATAAGGVWKAPDKAEEAKMQEIKIKAEVERKRMEQANVARRLRDARREVRDFSNSLNDLYDDELGQGRLPEGVITAKRLPNDSETSIGFNNFAELMNSRAAMIGFFAVLIIEGITGKGILTFAGLKIGSGIDIGL
eukprot:CAMPEP_0197515034 /NCGR_PEP_ID=MMETSP1318-20131121/284_1 /TAXON_ID=552666 /ORGANISM="Partenskyella glossopodia, Strain RCC365" /LENGTH=242 /DNA_ID=CAMNT_0043063289 /DNA_START=81 /DNA_END=809 /DNA_ORIENTATION=+